MYVFAKARRKRKSPELRGRHTPAHQTYFLRYGTDEESPVIRVLLHSLIFEMTADVYIKSDLYPSSDNVHLVICKAGGMIGEMKWNELSRTSLATTKWVITHTWGVRLHQQTFVEKWNKKNHHLPVKFISVNKHTSMFKTASFNSIAYHRLSSES